ncbi:ABC transporter substrate-binding protein [bacterium]|nr:ABC transporter substrate-binding protein [bacterium]
MYARTIVFLYVFWILLFNIPEPGYSKQQSTVSTIDSVILQLKWQHQFQFAGYYAAQEKGLYRDAGLNVTIREAADFSEPEKAVLKGKANFGISGSDVVLSHIQGEPVVALIAIFQHSPLVLLTKQNGVIQHIHDIVGKRVMLEPHSHEVLAYLKNEGVSLDRLIRYPHVFDVLPLINDEVDAMSAYITDEPFILNKERIAYQLFSPRASGIDFYGDILFTTAQEIDKNPERVRAFVDASMLGWKYAFENVDEIVDLILLRYSKRHSREHLKYEAEQMRQLVIPEIVEIGYMNPGRWEHIASTYATLGMIPERYSLEGFLYDRAKKSKSPWGYAIMGGLFVILLLLILVGFSQLFRKVLRGEK